MTNIQKRYVPKRTNEVKGNIKMKEEFKSGFVTIIGRTNVGKSTLINLLVGEKVAAIANKVQTTRTAIKGIVNRENSQIVFTDTPGIHKPKHKLNETMVETSFATIPDSDIVLFLIEATSEDIGRGDRIILDKIKESKRKTILIINKIDLVKRDKLLKLIDIYSKEYNFTAVIPISAYQEKYRDIILDEIEKNLKPGPAYYDIEEYTDQTLRQLAEETIREKALKLLQDEVPHGIYVEVEKMNLRQNKQGEDIYDIEATIYCLRESHKGIIIGKNGDMLKRIGRAARIDMEQNFGLKVNLKTWVKVKNDWLDNDSIVSKFKLK
ncbi:MAG: GTPase Era [Clostridia bacterium]